MLQKGKKYYELPDAYVIFICDFDPLGRKLYQYTLEQICVEDSTVEADAGAHTIFLSTKGENDDEVSEPLRKFLKYVGSELETCEKDFEDAYIKQLQETVRRVKRDRELGARYMLFQEMLDNQKEEGREEGRRETIFQLYDKGILTLEQASKELERNEDIFLSEYEDWKRKRVSAETEV